MRNPALTLVAASLLSAFMISRQSVEASEIADASGTQPESRQVTVVKPTHRDITRWVKLPAELQADAEITLYAKVSGFLKDFNVDIGDRLKPGQSIGKLDAPELEQDVKFEEAQVMTAQADYQKAQAELDRIQMRGEEIDAKEKVLQAELQKSRADLTRIQQQCNRTKALFEKDAATAQDKEYQEATCLEQEAMVKAAESKIDELKPEREVWVKDIATGKATVEASRGRVGVAQAALDRARVWYSYTDIKVPQIGTHVGTSTLVHKRFVANGDLIAGGIGSRSGIQPLVQLEAEDPIRVVAQVPEYEAIHVEAGTIVRISCSAFPDDKPIITKITRCSHSLSQSARTLRVEVDLPNPDLRLRSGLMATMELAVDLRKMVLAVPTACVLTERENSSVFMVDGGKAHKCMVTVGVRDHEWVEVLAKARTEGVPVLSEGTPLIQDVREGVNDGMSVSTKE